MLIRNDSGEVIGAVGVTGDTEDRDEELAVHGVHAASLKTDADCAGMGGKSVCRSRNSLFWRDKPPWFTHGMRVVESSSEARHFIARRKDKWRHFSPSSAARWWSARNASGWGMALTL